MFTERNAAFLADMENQRYLVTDHSYGEVNTFKQFLVNSYKEQIANHDIESLISSYTNEILLLQNKDDKYELLSDFTGRIINSYDLEIPDIVEIKSDLTALTQLAYTLEPLACNFISFASFLFFNMIKSNPEFYVNLFSEKEKIKETKRVADFLKVNVPDTSYSKDTIASIIFCNVFLKNEEIAISSFGSSYFLANYDGTDPLVNLLKTQNNTVIQNIVKRCFSVSLYPLIISNKIKQELYSFEFGGEDNE